MGLPISSGVSGGIAYPQGTFPTGVPLSLAGDYAVAIVSSAAPAAPGPGPGPDTSGVFVVSSGLAGGWTGQVTVAFQKVISVNDFNASNWTPLYGMIPRNNGQALISSTYTISSGGAMDFTAPTVQGFYAVRVLITVAPVTGQIVVSGQTYAVPTGALQPAEAALLTQVTALNQAQLLALCDMLGNTEYADAYGIIL
jgi:hypothetical protein